MFYNEREHQEFMERKAEAKRALDTKLGVADIGDYDQFSGLKGFDIKDAIRAVYRGNLAIAQGKALAFIREFHHAYLSEPHPTVNDEGQARAFIEGQHVVIYHLFEGLDSRGQLKRLYWQAFQEALRDAQVAESTPQDNKLSS